MGRCTTLTPNGPAIKRADRIEIARWAISGRSQPAAVACYPVRVVVPRASGARKVSWCKEGEPAPTDPPAGGGVGGAFFAPAPSR